jgi:hypothetical protein
MVRGLAAGFVLRVAAGVSLIEVQRFSPWLYVCTTLLALFSTPQLAAVAQEVEDTIFKIMQEAAAG